MESSVAKKALLAISLPTASPLFKAVFILALVFGVAPYSSAANRLLDIKYHSVVDHQLELQLVFEQQITEPQVNLNASPAQIVLGFNRSVSGLQKDNLPINYVDVKSVAVAQNNQRLDVRVNLERVKAYQGRVVGNTYRLTINDEVAGA